MLVEQILQVKGNQVTWIRRDATIAEAVATLREHNIGALIVSDDGNAVEGILSERDVVRALPDQAGEALERLVGDLMTAEVVSCSPSTPVEQLMALMTERRIRHVPVIDEGNLRGVISIGDVVKNRVGELETEAKTLHDYITSGR